MDIAKSREIKQFGEGRRKLLALEKEGKYVFHGSPNVVITLEPRQGYDLNKETGKMEKDGEPAVFATPYADMAIFRALINTNDVSEESTSNFGINEGQLHFSATKNLLDQAKQKTGRVYVLDKQKFQDFEGMQCRSDKSISPIEIIEVTTDDLPQNIETIK